ncbi:hypothetical protein [Methylovulum sp.]|uniref:hypothetical protein n=1 Tax=Methylovulum sp. TaxID=1916980 RepID=UPI0026242C38|nr:hypothetical protein [Methylovulum sp.]MDD5126273.1 hypothetical protein [Methylovulum sp.]
MSDLPLDEKIKEAQLKKLEAETAKIEAETSKLWLEIVKFVFSGLVGLGVGLFSQYTKVSWAELEKNIAVSQNEQMSKDTKESVDPLKEELTKVRAELQKAKPELVTKPLIYIQFQGNTTREFINELRGSLQAEFNVPGAQRIAGNYTSEVRYFSKNQDDEEKAKHLAESVKAFFKSKDCSLNLPIKFNEATAGKSSPPEVWLADEDFCG